MVIYAFDGAWSVGEFMTLRSELIGLGHLTTDSAVLFDLRAATIPSNLHDLATEVASSVIPLLPACRAFVVSSQEQYDCARHLQALLHPHSVVTQIFKDETEALAWLKAITARMDAPACGSASEASIH
jgi:hypothetical protein